MKTGSPNSASSNTGEGCPLNCAQAAPRDIVREALDGMIPAKTILSRRDTWMLVTKLVEHARDLEAQVAILWQHNKQLHDMIDGKPMKAKRKWRS